MTVAVADPLKVALGPVEGAVNVTATPLKGLLLASFTVACNTVANAKLTGALCGDPAVADTLGPATESAAPFKVTLPVPEVAVQLTFSVCPGEAAL
jgi:hypothetical protein